MALSLVLPLKTSATLGHFSFFHVLFAETIVQTLVVSCNVGDDDDDGSMW